MIEKKCVQCGASFMVGNYRDMTAKFCSVGCCADNKRGKIRKKNVTGNNGYRKTKTNGHTELSHRYIYSDFIGRPLLRGEIIHHKNGDKSDNRIENLMIMTPKEHAHHHNQKYPVIKQCEVCGCSFKPHPTKRKRAKTCSKECHKKLQSMILRKPSSPNSMYRESAYPCQVKQRIVI